MKNTDFDMSDMDKTFDKILKALDGEIQSDIGTYLVDKAQSSFRTRSFENTAWESTLFKSRSTGRLSASLKYNVDGNGNVSVTSDLPYADIQNEGGKVRVTDKMRKFFWSQFYSTKNGMWKGLALTKKKHLTIDARPFIQDTPETKADIAKIIENKVKRLMK